MARGGAQTLLGQLGRFVISFGSSIALARLVAPQDFGYMAMVAAFLTIGEAILDAGLSTAAIRRANLTGRQHSNLFWINLSLGTAFAVLAWFCAPLIALFYSNPVLVDITRCWAVIFVVGGIGAQFRVEITRQFRFGKLAIVDFVSPLIGSTCAIVLAVLGAGYWALIASLVIASFVSLILLVIFSRWRPGLPRREEGMLAILLDGAGIAGSWMLSIATRNVDSIALGRTTGPSVLAFYDRAFQLLMIPLYQFAWPLSRVAIPVLGRASSDRARFAQVLGRLQLASVYGFATMFALCVGLGPSIVVFLYGETWRFSGDLLRLLAIAGVFRGFAQVNQWAYVSRGFSAVQFRFDLIAQPLSVAVILCGLPWGATGVASSFTVASALYWLSGILWLGRRTKIDVKPLLIKALRGLGVAAVTAGVASFAGMLSVAPLLQIIFGVCFAFAWLALASLIFPAIRVDARSLVTIVASARKAK